MTTQNAVGRLIASWIARIEGSGKVVNIVSLAGMVINTSLLVMDRYGYSEYARPFIVVSVIGGLVVVYVYSEFIWNQKNRDTKDMSTNYSGPNLLMRYQMQAVQLATLAEGLEDGLDRDELETRLHERTIAQWAEFRTGVDESMLEENLPAGLRADGGE